MPRRISTPIYILIGALVFLIALFFITIPLVKEPFGNQPAIDLVIARYKEPIDWLNNYKDFPFRRIYIYNKSNTILECPATLQAKCNIESIPNVGVCDHTYLYHILKVYDDPALADITVFLPASAYSNETKREKIGKILEYTRENRPSMSGYRVHGDPKNDKLGGPDFHLDEWKVTDEKNRETSADFRLTQANPRPFGAWYKKYFPNDALDKISLQGMFGITHKMIQQNPIGLYQSLIKTVDHDMFPEAAHYMERSWATLFKSIPYESLI